MTQQDATHPPIAVRSVEQAPHSEVHLEGVVPNETVAAIRPRAIQTLAQTLVLDGFRPGKVPPHIAEKHLKESDIMREVVRLALEPHLPRLLEEHAPKAVAAPRVFVKEEADEEGVAFTLAVPVYPDIQLPDYRAVAERALGGAKPHSEEEQTEALERALTLLRKEHALKARKALNPEDTSTLEDISEDSLPPLTDEIAKSLGPFQSVAELKDTLQKDIGVFLTRERTEAARKALLDALLKETDFEVPLVFVELELMRIMEEAAVQLAAMGKTMEAFLEELGEKREALLQTWQEEAARRVKAQLILEAIAEAEHITEDAEAVKREADHILSHNPSLERESVEAFLRQRMRNEAVFRRLLGEEQHNKAERDAPTASLSEDKGNSEK
ncbi:MAG: trigger factor [Candidatus Parcubacteria bacterium]|nr:MAG: trigger factor [Candidatus Parcubacteria bacterium]